MFIKDNFGMSRRNLWEVLHIDIQPTMSAWAEPSITNRALDIHMQITPHFQMSSLSKKILLLSTSHATRSCVKDNLNTACLLLDDTSVEVSDLKHINFRQLEHENEETKKYSICTGTVLLHIVLTYLHWSLPHSWQWILPKIRESIVEHYSNWSLAWHPSS